MTTNQDVAPATPSIPPEMLAVLKGVGVELGPAVEEKVELVLKGRLTFGDLLGISKEKQYELAKEGYRHLSAKRLDEATRIFAGLQALDPYDAYFHTCLGTIAQEQESYEEAEQLYTKALGINPFSVHALANRGELRVMTGNKAEGLEDLKRALAQDPTGKQPAGQRAKVLFDQLTKAPTPTAPKSVAKK
jgi:tetratricopeptide (TPR) repeat protein